MIEAIWVLIIGIVLIALGWTKKAGGYNTLALGVGALMVIGGAFWPGYGYFEDSMNITTPNAGVAGTELNIVCANGSWNSANMTTTAYENGQGITVQVDNDGDSAFKKVYCAMNFSITPIPPSGADADSLVTVTASIPDDYTYAGYPVFDTTNGVPDVDWRCNAERTAEGGTADHTMKYGDTEWMELRMELDDGGEATSFPGEFATVGETFSIPVTITAADYSETFTLTFFVMTAT